MAKSSLTLQSIQTKHLCKFSIIYSTQVSEQLNLFIVQINIFCLTSFEIPTNNESNHYQLVAYISVN